MENMTNSFTVMFVFWFVVMWFGVGTIFSIMIYFKYRKRGVSTTLTDHLTYIALGWIAFYFWKT